MENKIIVKCGMENKEELVNIEKECFVNDNWETEIWEDIFNDLNRNIIYGIKENDKIIAFLMIYNWGTERGYVKITNIGVKKEYRNKGISKALIKHMLDEMTKNNMLEFRAETRRSNFPMQRVFEYFNFKNIDTRINYYDNPTEDAFVYILKYK